MGSAREENFFISVQMSGIFPRRTSSMIFFVPGISNLSWYSSRNASRTTGVLEYLSQRNLADLRSYMAFLSTMPNFLHTDQVFQFMLCVPCRDVAITSSMSYFVRSASFSRSSLNREFEEKTIRYASERDSTAYPRMDDNLSE